MKEHLFEGIIAGPFHRDGVASRRGEGTLQHRFLGVEIDDLEEGGRLNQELAVLEVVEGSELVVVVERVAVVGVGDGARVPIYVEQFYTCFGLKE